MSLCAYHPSLRFIIPMVGGIVCGDYFYDTEWVSLCLPIFVVLWGILLISYRRNNVRIFGLVAFLFFFIFGYAIVSRQLDRVLVPFSGESSCYQIKLLDHPVEKQKTFQYKAVLEGEWTRGGDWYPAVQKPVILCYLAKDSLMSAPSRGEHLCIYTQIRRPVPDHLPDAFDYSRYLRHHGISGTAYVSPFHWRRMGKADTPTFQQVALDARSQVVQQYRRLGFTGDELSVLSALTVGDKETLGEEIRETYSVSGASHVLALSGLHVGFLYGILLFLGSLIWKRWPVFKYPLSLGVIGGLWLFAFFTGLSISVVRAVVMCSLFILLSFRRESVWSFDTLLITAFFMLIYQPFWLFDVSFQLSFSAVAAILLIYPKLYTCLPVQSAFGKKIWGVLAVSLAAQLGTAPLILYYFSHFSTHFLLTNLWVIPLVSLTMYASVIMILLTPFPSVQSVFSILVRELLQLQHQGLRWIEHLPYASFDCFQLDVWEVAWLYLILYVGYRCMVRPVASRVQVLLGILLVGAVGHLISTVHDAPRAGISFYAAQGKAAIQCFTYGTRSWVVCTDSLSDSLTWKRMLQPYWNRLRLDKPQWVGQHYHSPSLLRQEQFLFYRGKCVCLLTDDRWRYRQAAHRLPVDYLYITRGYHGHLKELTAVFQLHAVIVDPRLSSLYRLRIQDECRELGLMCMEQKESGMLVCYW